MKSLHCLLAAAAVALSIGASGCHAPDGDALTEDECLRAHERMIELQLSSSVDESTDEATRSQLEAHRQILDSALRERVMAECQLDRPERIRCLSQAADLAAIRDCDDA